MNLSLDHKSADFFASLMTASVEKYFESWWQRVSASNTFKITSRGRKMKQDVSFGIPGQGPIKRVTVGIFHGLSG